MNRGSLPTLALGLTMGVTSCATASPPGHGSAPGAAVGLTLFPASQGARLPSLAGSTLTGRPLSATSYAAGSPLVINVWASWCSPCRRELPLLARASTLGVRVLGIDERDSASRARAFALSRGASYPSLLDADGRLLATLRMLPQTGVPSTLVVARDGHVVARVVGPLTRQSLQRALSRAGS